MDNRRACRQDSLYGKYGFVWAYAIWKNNLQKHILPQPRKQNRSKHNRQKLDRAKLQNVLKKMQEKKRRTQQESATMKIKVKLWENKVVMKQEVVKDPTTGRETIKTEPREFDAKGVIDYLIGISGINQTPEVYKQSTLSQLNEVEDKTYDEKMSFEEFVKVLEKEGIIEIIC
jgi:hypothetical protein